MSLSFCIVDDDASARRMLQYIIEDSGLGEVTGKAGGGLEGVRQILSEAPDIVLMDLLMPDQDGIAVIDSLRAQGCSSRFVMISQIENQEMVGRAYRSGIEFFIRKPINRIEVESVLRKINERYAMSHYLDEIKLSLKKLEGLRTAPLVPAGRRSVRETIHPILMNLGLIGEIGSRDIITIMELLLEPEEGKTGGHLPPLKELYRQAAATYKTGAEDIAKEVKAIEQRLRRALTAALTNLASLGLTDYGNPRFEYYAPLYFDFEDVRLKMKQIEEGRDPGVKGKVNIKKFLQVLYIELQEQLGG